MIDVVLLEPDSVDDADVVERVVEVVNRAYTEAERELWRRPLPRTDPSEVRTAISAHEVVVARVDGAIVGSMFVRMLDPATGWFGALGVEPAVGGGGIGRSLVAFAERWAVDSGASRMQIEVLVPAERVAYSERLAAWYARLGYDEVASRQLVEFDPNSVEDALVDIRVVTMRKQLS